MRNANRIGKLLTAIARFMAPRPLSRFSCGDCERNAQGGLPPDDNCSVKLSQIARDDESLPRRPDYLYPAVWPR